MKKTIIFLVFIFVLILPVKAYAAEDYIQKIEDITQQYNINNIELSEISVTDVIDYILTNIKEKRSEPIKLTTKLIAVILLYSVVQVIYADNVQGNVVYDNICTLIVFTNLLEPTRQILSLISNNLFSVKNFMVSFLPVYAGVSMASGEVFSSAIYTGFLLSAMVFISDMCLSVVLPSVRVYFALIISNAMSPYIRLKSMADFYTKAVKGIMRISVSVICFILTIQSTIAQGKDTLAVKAGKILAGSAIPIIGSTLQDAVSSVYAGMESIKGFAGAAGLVTVAGIFLPSIIYLIVYWCRTNFLYIICDIFDAAQIKTCIKGFIEIIQLMISIVVLYMVMLIFALTILIAVTNGI